MNPIPSLASPFYDSLQLHDDSTGTSPNMDIPVSQQNTPVSVYQNPINIPSHPAPPVNPEAELLEASLLTTLSIQETSLEQAQKQAQNYLTAGLNHEWGRNGASKDLQRAFGFYMQAATLQLAAGQYQLGRCYEHGLGVNKDWESAFFYFDLAAKQGFAKAEKAQAMLYAMGRGIDKDLTKAFELLTSASKHGHKEAKRILASFYIKGLGIEQKDPEYGVVLLKELVALKYPNALYDLGLCYLHGVGVEARSLKTALLYLNEAAALFDEVESPRALKFDSSDSECKTPEENKQCDKKALAKEDWVNLEINTQKKIIEGTIV